MTELARRIVSLVLVAGALAACADSSAEPSPTVGPGPTTTRPWTPGVIQLTDCDAADEAGDGDCGDGFRLDGREYVVECEELQPDVVGDVVGRDGPVDHREARAVDGIEPQTMVAVTPSRCDAATWSAAISRDVVEHEFPTARDAICRAAIDPGAVWSCDE